MPGSAQTFHPKLSAINPKKGFTLIELMIAIAIMAVLSTIGIVAYSKAQSSTRDARRKQDLRAVQSALELYYQKNNSYPAPADNSPAVSNDPRWSNTLTSNLAPNFINQMPVDPYSNNNGFYYAYQSNGTTYSLAAKLENGSDPDIKPCTLFSGCNYLIVSQ